MEKKEIEVNKYDKAAYMLGVSTNVTIFGNEFADYLPIRKEDGQKMYEEFEEGKTVENVYLPTVLDNIVTIFAIKNSKAYAVDANLNNEEFAKAQNMVWAKRMLGKHSTDLECKNLIKVVNAYLENEDFSVAEKVGLINFVNATLMKKGIDVLKMPLGGLFKMGFNHTEYTNNKESVAIRKSLFGYKNAKTIYERAISAIESGVSRFHNIQNQAAEDKQM